jgi:hypothetical protein
MCWLWVFGLLGGFSLDVLMMEVVALVGPLLSGCCESLGVPCYGVVL